MNFIYSTSSTSLSNILQDIVTEEASQCRNNIQAMGEDILNYARVYAPVDTGTLLESANAEWQDDEFVVGFGNNEEHDLLNPKTDKQVSDYAFDVEEFGTTKKPEGYHYLQRAAMEVLPNWSRYFKNDPVNCTDDGGDFDFDNIPF